MPTINQLIEQYEDLMERAAQAIDEEESKAIDAALGLPKVIEEDALCKGEDSHETPLQPSTALTIDSMLQQAQSLAKDIQVATEEELGKEHPDSIKAAGRLAEVAGLAGGKDLALDIYMTTYEKLAAVLPSDDIILVQFKEDLSIEFFNAGDYVSAAECATEVYDYYMGREGAPSDRAATADSPLAKATDALDFICVCHVYSGNLQGALVANQTLLKDYETMYAQGGEDVLPDAEERMDLVRQRIADIEFELKSMEEEGGFL